MLSHLFIDSTHMSTQTQIGDIYYCLYRNMMLILKESCPNNWKDLLLEQFLAPLRHFHSRGGSKHKTFERAFSWTGANDDTVVEV